MAGLDGVEEQEAILARSRGLMGGRWYDSLPEEALILRDAGSGLVLPYGVITFGSLYPSGDDRTITGEEDQPHYMPIIWECWGPDMDSVRRCAGAIRTRFVGWAPTRNATPIELRGGGWFQNRDASGRPTRFMQSVTGLTKLNQSIPQG